MVTATGGEPLECRTDIGAASLPLTARALDELIVDDVVLLANNASTFLGKDGQDDLFAALTARSAVVFIHPADLPGPDVPGVLPFATDFLLDTTRAAYLLVRNGIRRKCPNIKFVLSHASGFVPYASHRMAVAIMGDTGRSPADSLDDFSGFYFDTALSSSSAALPTLLAFAQPINRDNALRLFPRLGSAPMGTVARTPVERLRHNASRVSMRGAVKLIGTR
jgi:predicted TIM-barrel fold metal-dependent hydrolase